MTQREYILRNVREQWTGHYMLNYLFDRILREAPTLSDLELFQPRHEEFILENGTIAEYFGKRIRLIGNSNEKIEESRAELSKLLNGVPLLEV